MLKFIILATIINLTMAKDLYVDGKKMPYSFKNMNMDEAGNIYVKTHAPTDGGGSNPGNGSGSNPGNGGNGSGSTACGSKNTNAITSGLPEILSQVGTNTSAHYFLMPTGNKVFSQQFSVTPNTSGEITLVGSSSSAEHTRQMWISECPGGPVFGKTQEEVKRCSVTGRDSSIAWATRRVELYGGLIKCPIEANKKYYLNLKYKNPDECDRSNGCYAIMRNSVVSNN